MISRASISHSIARPAAQFGRPQRAGGVGGGSSRSQLRLLRFAATCRRYLRSHTDPAAAMALATASTTLLQPGQPAQRPFRPLDRRNGRRTATVQCRAGWQEGSETGGWRQRAAAAAAAALLTMQGLVLPAPSLAAASPVPSVAAELQQQQAVPAQQTPDSLALPPVPSTFPPLPPLALPAYKQITLKNGLRVFLLEDHELPLVRGERPAVPIARRCSCSAHRMAWRFFGAGHRHGDGGPCFATPAPDGQFTPHVATSSSSSPFCHWQVPF